MGGYGSGHHVCRDPKTTTDAVLSIDVRELNRRGSFKPGQSFVLTWTSDGKTLGSINVEVLTRGLAFSHSWRHGDEEPELMHYPVRLEWTRCHLGGKRPWFLCPMPGCGRRVAILYSGQKFACRHCCDLVYQSQREPGYWRPAERAFKIRKRLGWPGGLYDCGPKPKGMHWKTFNRLVAQHDALVERFDAYLEPHLDAMRGPVEDWI